MTLVKSLSSESTLAQDRDGDNTCQVVLTEGLCKFPAMQCDKHRFIQEIVLNISPFPSHKGSIMSENFESLSTS